MKQACTRFGTFGCSCEKCSKDIAKFLEDNFPNNMNEESSRVQIVPPFSHNNTYMKILKNEIDKTIQINIKCSEYFLTKGNEEHEYAICPKIDMSYAGKLDQCASPIIMLSKEDYEKLRGLFDEYGL